jgi:hypothetical protein
MSARMKIYHFRQNNSGGQFDIDKEKGIGPDVIVCAVSANQAVSYAKSIGIYFDGCATGQDCDCCGDRWSEPWREEDTDDPHTVPYEHSVAWSDDYYIHDATTETFTAHPYKKEDTAA